MMLKALVQAQLDPTYTPILKATVGIVFLATPHRGSETADMATVAVRIGKAVFPKFLLTINKPLITSLKKDCNSLFERASNFMKICSGMKIYSFYEQDGMAGQMVRQTKRASKALTSLTRAHRLWNASPPSSTFQTRSYKASMRIIGKSASTEAKTIRTTSPFAMVFGN